MECPFVSVVVGIRSEGQYIEEVSSRYFVWITPRILTRLLS